jgi:hypothetical protein
MTLSLSLMVSALGLDDGPRKAAENQDKLAPLRLVGTTVASFPYRCNNQREGPAYEDTATFSVSVRL